MDPIISSLIPVFAAGLAIQQLMEVLDPLVNRLIGDRDKKLVLGAASLGVGLVLAFGCGLRVLSPLGAGESPVLDGVVTALIISAGTEAFNSILKILGYAKEDRKVKVATTLAGVRRDYVANDIIYRMDGRKAPR